MRATPVGGAAAFGDAKSEENPRQIADSRLFDAMPIHDRAEVDDVFLLKRKNLLEALQIVGETDAHLGNRIIFQHLSQRTGELRSFQLKEINPAASGDLHQAWRMGLSFAERRLRFRIQTDDMFATNIAHCPLQILPRGDQTHRSFVTAHGQLIEFVSGNLMPDVVQARLHMYLKPLQSASRFLVVQKFP